MFGPFCSFHFLERDTLQLCNKPQYRSSAQQWTSKALNIQLTECQRSIIQGLTQIDRDRLACEIISLNSSSQSSKSFLCPILSGRTSFSSLFARQTALLPFLTVFGKASFAHWLGLLPFNNNQGIAMNFAAQFLYSRVFKNRTPRERFREEEEYDPFWQRLENVAMWRRPRVLISSP